MNKNGFSLVELVVVITVIVILSVVSIGAFSRLIQEGDFETSIDRIYNDISALSLETIISRANISRASFYKSFSGGFFVYRENTLDSYKTELAFLSGSVISGGKIAIDFQVKNNQIASGVLLSLVAHNPNQEDISTPVSLSGSRVILANTGFLSFSSLAKLSEYRFALIDRNSSAVRSGDIYFIANANNINNTSILISRLEGTDFRRNVGLFDSLDISFDIKGRKKITGVVSGVEKILKSVKIILLHTKLNKNMYFELN